MKKWFMYYIVIMGIIPLVAMNEKSLWIKTTDNQLRYANPHIIAASNLLTVLRKKHQGSYTNPIEISIPAESFNLFCAFHPISAKTLYNTLAPNSYYQLMDVADKLKALSVYVNLLCKALPNDIIQKYIPKNIETIRKNKVIKKYYTKKELITNLQRLENKAPEVVISNDGNYVLHNIRSHFNGLPIKLWDIKKNLEIDSFCSIEQNLKTSFFSPNSTYAIIQGHEYVFMYLIAKKKQYPLCISVYCKANQEISISPDSKHIILFEPLSNHNALWSIDSNNKPQQVFLEPRIWDRFVQCAIFNHDSKKIIYNGYQKSLNTCSIESPNTPGKQSKLSQENYHSTNTLSLLSDGIHVIAHSPFPDLQNFKDTIFSLKNIHTYTSIPNQSCANILPLPRLDIPHKKLVTHICNMGHTLQLLDLDAQVIASHTTKSNAHISALAADTTGNYLACGYSDGTIIMWNLSNADKRIEGIKVTMPSYPIKSLTFGNNQLLLAQSGEYKYNLISKKTISQRGSAIVWDVVHGNKIFDFCNTIASAMSKNGNRIITISETLRKKNEPLGEVARLITVSAWNLHNKKIAKKLHKQLTQPKAILLNIQYEADQQKKYRKRST